MRFAVGTSRVALVVFRRGRHGPGASRHEQRVRLGLATAVARGANRKLGANGFSSLAKVMVHRATRARAAWSGRAAGRVQVSRACRLNDMSLSAQRHEPVGSTKKDTGRARVTLPSLRGQIARSGEPPCSLFLVLTAPPGHRATEQDVSRAAEIPRDTLLRKVFAAVEQVTPSHSGQVEVGEALLLVSRTELLNGFQFVTHLPLDDPVDSVRAPVPGANGRLGQRSSSSFRSQCGSVTL